MGPFILFVAVALIPHHSEYQVEIEWFIGVVGLALLVGGYYLHRSEYRDYWPSLCLVLGVSAWILLFVELYMEQITSHLRLKAAQEREDPLGIGAIEWDMPSVDEIIRELERSEE